MLVTAVYCELLSCSFSTLHWQRGRPVVSGQSPQSLWWLLVFQASIRSIYTRWCNRSTMAKMDQAARKSVSCCWYRGQNEAKSFFTLLCWRRGVWRRGAWHLRNFAAERRWFWNGERETHRVIRPQKECRVWNLQLSASETELMNAYHSCLRQLVSTCEFAKIDKEIK